MRRPESVLVAVAAMAFACTETSKSDTTTSPSPTCRGAQAMSATDIRGTSLPAKTIALTFDDGPGLRTSELSTYLESQKIRAAFFVNGQMVTDKAILEQLVADGHVVGNHTQTHRSMTGRSGGLGRLSDDQVIDELTRTDAIIAPYVPNARFLFRPPYGDYDDHAYEVVAASPMNKYVGPVNWDIGDHMGPAQAADWDCWIPGDDGVVKTPQQCAELYVQEIDAVGRGIVLLHDPYFIDDDPAKGGTVDMVFQIVPALLAKGYTFARLDEVPDVARLLPPLPADPAPDASTPPTTPTTPSTADARPTAPQTNGGNPDPCSGSPQSTR